MSRPPPAAAPIAAEEMSNPPSGAVSTARRAEAGTATIGTSLAAGRAYGSIGIADAAGAARGRDRGTAQRVAIVRLIVVESMSTPSGCDRRVRSMRR